MPEDRALTCGCGQMIWQVRPDAAGSRIRCYCADCQTFARYLGQEHFLDPNGGTDIFQTLPDTFAIMEGQEHLAALRLGPKGLLRWYAGCCSTPIANTLPAPSLPFVGVILPQGCTGFGPLSAQVNTTAAKTPVKETGMIRTGIAIMTRALGAILSGRRSSLFFGPDKTPVVAPKVLTLDERNAARPH